MHDVCGLFAVLQMTSFPKVLRRTATSTELSGYMSARNCGRNAVIKYK